jgi:hypothetical protein
VSNDLGALETVRPSRETGTKRSTAQHSKFEFSEV